MQILVNFLQGKTLVFESQNYISTNEIKQFIQNAEGIPPELQRLRLGTHELSNSEIIQVKDKFVVVNCSFRILGGKGGFGALLRGSGTHSKGGSKRIGFDDCRDLNGRRIRDIKLEKKLAEWYNQQKQKELQKEKEKESMEENGELLEHMAWNQTREEIEETIATSVEIGMKQALKMKKKKSEPESKVPFFDFDEEEEKKEKENEKKEEKEEIKQPEKKDKESKKETKRKASCSPNGPSKKQKKT